MTGKPDSLKCHSLYGARFETAESFRHPIPGAKGPAAFRYETGDSPPAGFELPGSPPAFESGHTDESGVPLLTFFRGEEYDLFRFRDVLDFYVGDEMIRSVVHDPEAGVPVELYFIGAVLSHWMERQHRPVLHAAVVAHRGRSIAFMAGNKSGKSSLALGCLGAGADLLSDDLLPLEERSDGFWAHPGYPEMRLWPEAVEAAGLGDPLDFALVHPGEVKRRIPIGSETVRGGFASGGRPLAGVFLPMRGAADSPLRIRRIDSRAEALRGLIGGSFLIPFPRAIGVDGTRMEMLGRLARDVPVYRLEYPAGWDRLPEVAREILRRVEES